MRISIAGQISRKKYSLGTVVSRADGLRWNVLIDGATSPAVYECLRLSLPEADTEAPAQAGRSAPRQKTERKPRAAPSGNRKPSKSSELDASAARGETPTKPIMTSKANPHYQKRFDKLEAMAMVNRTGFPGGSDP